MQKSKGCLCSLHMRKTLSERPRLREASIGHDGKSIHLGNLHGEQDAAKAFDAKARELRGDKRAHGGSLQGNWLRLNFPTAQEQAYAKQQGMPMQNFPTAQEEAYAAEQGMPTHEENAEREAKAAEQHYKSSFIGVCWNKKQTRSASTPLTSSPRPQGTSLGFS